MLNSKGVLAAKDSIQSDTVGVVEPQTIRLQLPPEGFRLEQGGALHVIDVAYECCGLARPEGDNVLFVCHALTGDAHIAGIRPGETEASGWWEGMVGPGKGIDTDHYRVICANVLGGCKGTTGPSSVNPETGRPYGSAFPRITIRDIVEVHRLFLQQIGVKHLAGIVGGSFGGMQVMEWLINHSEEVDRAFIIASAASMSSQALAFDIIGRDSITSDPNWNNGDYYGQDGGGPAAGLSNARQIAHITYLSPDLMEKKFGREKRQEWLDADKGFKAEIRRHFGTYFQVESYLRHQGDKFIRRFDANSYLQISLATDEFDIEEKYGSLEKAFAGIRPGVRILVVSMSGDWLFTRPQSEEIVSALVKNKKRVSYCHLETEAGHDAFLTHICDLKRVVRACLLAGPEQRRAQAIRRWQLRHYQPVVPFVPEGARVLDLGCGNGSLLKILERHKHVTGNGIELDVEEVIPALAAGCDVIREDLDKGLATIPDNNYDVVTLSETLQTIRRPRALIRETLRVAHEVVISFPNFASFQTRAQLMFGGRMPKGKELPYEWYDTPNIHLFTLKDFRDLCRTEGLVIVERRYTARHPIDRLLLALGLKSLGAEKVILRLRRKEQK